MATLKLIRNGTRKVANKRRRRRNTATAVARKPVANKRRRRNSVSSASVKSFAERNGMKLVRKNSGIKKVANKRKHHRRHRRNGVSVRNGLLGNSRETVTSVVALLVGTVATKIEGGIATPIVSGLLNPLGFGQYAPALTQIALSLTVNKWAGDAIGKQFRAPNAGKFVMLGGLAMGAMSLIEQFLPQASAYNPFASVNTMPIATPQTGIVNGNVAAALAAANGVSPATMGSLIRMNPRIGTGYNRANFPGGGNAYGRPAISY